jgi:alpha-tubulin suppressor-like RCC1 family protein
VIETGPGGQLTSYDAVAAPSAKVFVPVVQNCSSASRCPTQSLAGDFNHSASINADGSVSTWGNNAYGQLGYSTFGSFGPTPATVPTTANTVGIASGSGDHTLTVQANGTVWAWGANFTGQLGNGNTTNSTAPVETSAPTGQTGPLSNVSAVAAETETSLALKWDGTVWAWGAADLGNGGANTSNLPVQVIGPGGTGVLTGILSIAGGAGYALALRNDGTVWGWGDDSDGQLGDGRSGAGVSALFPIQVKGSGGSGFLSNVTAIAAGGSHSLAVKSDGTVWAWGYNHDGELGNGAKLPATDVSTPVQVLGVGGGRTTLTGIAAVAAGYFTSYALGWNGSVYAWGYNYDGELGNGAALPGSPTSAPIQVIAPVGQSGSLAAIDAISAGDLHGLALGADGSVVTWGSNQYGQLGNPGVGNSSTPVSTGLSAVPQACAPAMGSQVAGCGYYTGMSIQNTTGTAGTVSVTYYDQSGNTTVRTFSIGANGLVTVHPGSTDGPPSSTFDYSAVINSTVPVAAISEVFVPTISNTARVASAENLATGGSSSLGLALVEDNGSDGWSTNEEIMNVGTSAATFTVSYYDSATGLPIGTPQSFSVSPNMTFNLNDSVGLNPGNRATATLTSTAGSFAIICNENGGTRFMNYSAQ